MGDQGAVQTVVVRAQFTEMLAWLGRGWQPAPAGRRCPECGGPVWLKAYRRPARESHRCVYCPWSQEYVM